MNKFVMLTVVALVPAAVLADMNINVQISGNSHSTHCDYEEYVDDGEPWFEDEVCDGSMRMSFEYQWTFFGPHHVLRYRKVTFNPWNNQWIFGSWMIKDHVCHHSCRLHHKHVYYRYKTFTPSWKRVYRDDGGRRVCFYEYQNHGHKHNSHPQVYRYEYKPRIKVYRDDNRQNHGGYKQGHSHYNHKNSSDGLYKNDNQHKTREYSAGKNGINKVSGRERLH